jgi:large subunit ribosomal protein L3
VPYPASLKQAVNSNDAAPAAADTPAEDVAAVEATEGQEG